MFTIFQWRMVSRRHFYIAGSVLRARYIDLIKPFVQHPRALSDALRARGAVISGSLALQFFLPSDEWKPSDMDIYVSHSEFAELTNTLENDPSLQFTPHVGRSPTERSTSYSLEVTEIRRYTTPTNMLVDVIRSRRDSPVSPLVQFWTSLLVNFVFPDRCGSAYPKMMFNGSGYVKEFGMTAQDDAAMRKYMVRPFQGSKVFSFVPELWGTWRDPSYWVRDYFSDRSALVVDFRARPSDSSPPMPVHPQSDGWKLVIPFPTGAYHLL